MHLAPLIQDLAVILGIAGLMSLLFRRIRQPVVLGYIIAGMIVGPYTPPFQLVTDVSGIRIWAELGVIFLMFSLGLEFSFRKLARVGTSAVVTAGTEVIFFIPVGYLVGKWLGWSSVDSIFLGAMLSMSSTTIIIKALDELKLKTHRFAELVFAALIVEDLIAILLLVGLSTVALTSTISTLELLTAILKLILIVGGWIIAGYFVVPRFMKYVGKYANNEMITLLSLGLCLGLVVAATHFKYSTALGAFIMGSILAETTLLHRIEGRMESLRDLFGAVFFVSIGMLMDPRILWEHKGTVALLCLFTIFGKILSTSFGALISGQSFNNSVKVGFGLAQIGEFSFIIATLGVTLQVTSDFVYPIIVAVSLVTTFTTPYLIRLSGPAAEFMERHLPSKLRNILNRYAVITEERRTRGAANKELKLVALRWIINGLVVSIVFLLGAQILVPYVKKQISVTPFLSALITWFICAVLSAPFIWAMLSAYKKYYAERSSEKVSATIHIAVSQVATMVWLALLTGKYFPGRYLVLLFCAVLIGFFIVFRKRLDASYRWYEQNFLSGIKNTSEDSSASAALNQLAPWDAHFVKISVHPNSTLVMKRISDAAFRTRLGVNIVAIQRGLETFIAPKPDLVILPRDELILLGTDAQVEKLRTELEAPAGTVQVDQRVWTYELRNFRLSNQSSLAHQTIRQSGIREKFHSMIVGLERDNRRSMNPDSDITLLPEDILWVVGDRKQLNDLATILLV